MCSAGVMTKHGEKQSVDRVFTKPKESCVVP